MIGAALSEPTRFVLAGAWNTAVGLVLFALLDATLAERVAVEILVVMTYAVNLPIAYAIQRTFVFRRCTRAGSARRFALANTGVFLANLAVVPMVVRASGWPALPVQVAFVVASTVASYLLHRHWSFAPR